MRIRLIGLLILIVMGCDTIRKQETWVLSNPDHPLRFELHIENGQLKYWVKQEGQVVIDTSRLGVIRNDADLSQNLSFVAKTEAVAFTDDFTLPTGKQRKVNKQGIRQSFTFENALGNQLTITCQLYEDGLALRQEFPERSDQEVIIEKDLMTFNLSAGGRAWLQPYDEVTKWEPAYEEFYKEVVIGTDSPYGHGWCFPALFKMPSSWVLLSESGIDGDYAGSHLDHQAKEGIYALRWPESDEYMGLYSQKPVLTLPGHTSWKTIALGKNLDTIIQSDLVKQVARKSSMKQTAWIKPGVASWSWLSDHDSPLSFEKLKSFVDLAAEMDWEYSLVDANWIHMKGGNIRELIEYANAKKVGLLLWYNSGGKHNTIIEAPRDIVSDKEKRKTEFARLQEWGIKGVKVDFFQSDKPEMMKLYKEILEDAATYELMVNFHGCTIPRGWSKTYPHLMTMEAVKGAETYTFSNDYARYAPIANTILPFTRNVVGGMDYTPVLLSDQYVHITTKGHELALTVLFESGILHMADKINGFEKQPEEVKQLLRDLPTAWDEVKLLQGYPGKEVVIARREANTWYVGGINGEGMEKEWSIDLSFIEQDVEWLVVQDDENQKMLRTQHDVADKKVSIKCPPYGGFIIQAKLVSDSTEELAIQ
ncbi:glycoside hydrolase family 97 catalytic domain-containing protein [Limibacter armeniacum]|uniref:glycoside hydrolase family 97 protein n=1 Tax=Limibacter armeniacum TaxID=466084 RepID=UPI002FE53BDE